MRQMIIAVVLALAVPAFAQQSVNTANPGVSAHPDGTIPATPPAALTDAERCSVDSLAQRATIMALRAEIAKLQARVSDLEAPLVQQAVQKERAELEQRFRERIKPPEGAIFNWSTLTFEAPTAAATPAPSSPPVK